MRDYRLFPGGKAVSPLFGKVLGGEIEEVGHGERKEGGTPFLDQIHEIFLLSLLFSEIFIICGKQDR